MAQITITPIIAIQMECAQLAQKYNFPFTNGIANVGNTNIEYNADDNFNLDDNISIYNANKFWQFYQALFAIDQLADNPSKNILTQHYQKLDNLGQEMLSDIAFQNFDTMPNVCYLITDYVTEIIGSST